jgi:hypothetical protein
MNQFRAPYPLLVQHKSIPNRRCISPVLEINRMFSAREVSRAPPAGAVKSPALKILSRARYPGSKTVVPVRARFIKSTRAPLNR